MNCRCPSCTDPDDHDVWGPDEEIEKLQEENQHLRAALERIRDLLWGESGDIVAAQEIAREVLG